MQGLLKLIGVVALIALLIGVLMGQYINLQGVLGIAPTAIAETMPEPLLPDASTANVVVDKQTVIREMRGLNRLETYSAVVQTDFVLQNEAAKTIWSAFTGKSLSMVGQGTVIAGVDLSNIGEQTVTVNDDGSYVRIELPDTEVFALTIDQAETGVVEYRNGFLVFDDGMQMNEQANAKVHDELLNKACEAQITVQAAEKARENIVNLVRALNPNIQEVDVVVSAGDCKSIAPIR